MRDDLRHGTPSTFGVLESKILIRTNNCFEIQLIIQSGLICIAVQDNVTDVVYINYFSALDNEKIIFEPTHILYEHKMYKCIVYICIYYCNIFKYESINVVKIFVI